MVFLHQQLNKMHYLTSRFLNTSCIRSAVDKTFLAKLRKKTGYTILNCKKALEACDNDVEKAEELLKAQALEQGWAKVTKLAGRTTAHGLIGVHVEGNVAALLEVNCETDFVARNQHFKDVVAQFTKDSLIGVTPSDQELVKEELSSEQLQSLTNKEGKSLSDLLALTIGKMGENMKLSRGFRLRAPSDINLVGYSHPAPSPDNPQQLLGKYGTVLALKNLKPESEIGRQLCIHVIGMNPDVIGTDEDLEQAIKGGSSRSDSDSDSDSSSDSSTDEEEKSKEKSKEKSESSENEKTPEPNIEKEDTPEPKIVLYHQEFLIDADKNVGQVVHENNIKIIDFVRFQLGETTNDT